MKTETKTKTKDSFAFVRGKGGRAASVRAAAALTEPGRDMQVSDPKGPKIEALATELMESVNDSAVWTSRMNLAEDSRWCIWEGQCDDGRKHAYDADDPPFPWDNASDTRARLVDTLVREACRVQNQGFRRARRRLVSPAEAGDTALAAKANTALTVLTSAAGRRWEAQRKLAMDWRNSYGVSVSMLQWERRVENRAERVGVEDALEAFGLGQYLDFLEERFGAGFDFEGFAGGEEIRSDAGLMAAQDELRNAFGLIYGEDRTAEASETLMAVFPGLSPGGARRALRDLRRDGAAQVPLPYEAADGPSRTALKVFDNVFFPANTACLETARWVAVRDWATEAEVHGKAASGEWTEAFAEELLKHEGKTSTATTTALRRTETKRWSGDRDTFETARDDTGGLYEVFSFFYRAADPETGVSGVFKTELCMAAAHGEGASAKVRGAWGSHGLLEDGAGRMPFVEHVYYRDSDRLLDNMGIPYLLYTHQNEVKTQRDRRVDAADLSVIPPVIRPFSDMDVPLTIAPDTPVYETLKGSVRFMEPPENRSAQSVELEEAVRAEAYRLTGAQDAATPREVVLLHAQDTAEDYLAEESAAMVMALDLARVHKGPEWFERAAGKGAGALAGKPPGAEEFDVVMSFDSAELDPEFRGQKIEAILRVLETDTEGRLKRGAVTEDLLSMIDPHLSDRWVQPDEDAAYEIVKDQKERVNMMLNGIEPARDGAATNPALRMRTMQEVGQSPAAVARAEADETGVVAQLLEAEAKWIQHAQDQQENKLIGRSGVGQVLPALGRGGGE